MNGPRYGGSWTRECGAVIYQLFSNRGFLDKDDLEILKFLASKGDHETKKAILIDKKIENPLYKFMEKNYPETLKKYKNLKMIVK